MQEALTLRWQIVSYNSPMPKHLSVCPLDCPDTCSVLITVEMTKLEASLKIAHEEILVFKIF
jgi:hypothetical protein